MTTTIATNAGRGAAYLDETTPGWADRIDLDNLRLSDKCACVLGQLDGDYDTALRARGLRGSQPARLGFTTSGRQTFVRLTAAWRYLVTIRQGRG